LPLARIRANFVTIGTVDVLTFFINIIALAFFMPSFIIK
jgi:hypothetical protein